MIKFLLGIVAGIIIFFFFLYFGGGKAVKRVGEGLTDTGKKMEVMEEVIRKEKENLMGSVEKKPSKEEKEIKKKSQ